MIYALSAAGDVNVAPVITWFGQGAVICLGLSLGIALLHGYLGTFFFDREDRQVLTFGAWAFAVVAAACYIADHLAVAWVR